MTIETMKVLEPHRSIKISRHQAVSENPSLLAPAPDLCMSSCALIKTELSLVTTCHAAIALILIQRPPSL